MDFVRHVQLRPGRRSADVEELTYIWRDAVEATHHFLPLSVIERQEQQVRDVYLPALRLQVAERNGALLGFIGMKAHKVAMLFVADEARSRGVGSLLIDWAQGNYPSLTLEVNEQNPRAAVFYINRGFVVTGRSAVDHEGLPYPLLHLGWRAGAALAKLAG